VSDMLPYLMMVLCCAQFPAGIVVGILIKSYKVAVKIEKSEAVKRQRSTLPPSTELAFDDID
jgi:hypothetical protein